MKSNEAADGGAACSGHKKRTHVCCRLGASTQLERATGGRRNVREMLSDVVNYTMSSNGSRIREATYQ